GSSRRTGPRRPWRPPRASQRQRPPGLSAVRGDPWWSPRGVPDRIVVGGSAGHVQRPPPAAKPARPTLGRRLRRPFHGRARNVRAPAGVSAARAPAARPFGEATRPRLGNARADGLARLDE